MRYFKKIQMAARVKKEEKKGDEAKAVISSSLEKNLTQLKEMLGDSSDVVIKEFRFGCNHSLEGALLCIDGLVSSDLVSNALLKPLMYDTAYKLSIDKECRLNFDSLNPVFVSVGETKTVRVIEDLLHDLLSGNSIIVVDGAKEALTISTRSWEKRGVEEPATENVVRGPRQGFTETLRTNTSMLRRIIKNPGLRFESVIVGKQTKTDICIAYIKDIVKPGLVKEIKNRLQSISTDSILDSGYVEAFIEDSPYSIFSTIGYSERPDVIAGKMLEGRAAIIVDGSPIVITAPMVFIEQFQTSEDYYIRTYFATYLRFIRLISFFLTILAPALYVAITTFHQELIPTSLLFTMTAGLSGVPFPALVEALAMVITFDILKEAGIRLPKPIGSAISIVGALVIGESAVSAGVIGPFMVIIVAITAITSFVIPKEMDSITILRYIMLILAGFLGGFGIVMGLLAILIYLVSMRSFGVAYLSPITPFSREGMKDTFVRAPLWLMLFRPKKIAGSNQKRRGKTIPVDYEK
jgi:spore germination protein KA